MEVKNLLFVVLCFSTIFESVVIGIPLVVIVSIILYLVDESKKTLFFIFIAANILDSLKAEHFGLTSLFVFFTLLLLDVYKRNFEVRDVKPIILIMFASSFVYMQLFGYNFNIICLFILVALFTSILLGPARIQLGLRTKH